MFREPYDWARDDGLDFPDEGEPTTDEVKEAAYRCQIDESAGLADRRFGVRDD